jgi:outer membrane receptor protein involved in Fe transport
VVVARGANALTYGASTLGGAMDFISPTARDSAPLDLFVNGGSFGLVQGRFSASRVFGDLDGLVTLEAKQRDGYRDHNEQERVGLYANGGWRLGPAVQTRFFATYVKNDEQLRPVADQPEAGRAGCHRRRLPMERRDVAPGEQDDVGAEPDQQPVARPVVRGTVALPPDRVRPAVLHAADQQQAAHLRRLAALQPAPG